MLIKLMVIFMKFYIIIFNNSNILLQNEFIENRYVMIKKYMYTQWNNIQLS